MKQFDDLFKTLSDLEGVPYNELIPVNGSVDLTADIKFQGEIVYQLVMNLLPVSTSITTNKEYYQPVEILYSLERVDESTLRPRLSLKNNIIGVNQGNLNIVELNRLWSKLRTVYDSIQEFGVLTPDDKKSFSYQMWGEGGLAELYIDPTSDIIQHFYRDRKLHKTVGRDYMTEVSYEENGNRKVSTIYFNDKNEIFNQVDNIYNSEDKVIYYEHKQMNGDTIKTTYKYEEDEKYRRIIAESVTISRNPTSRNIHQYTNQIDKETGTFKTIRSRKVTVSNSYCNEGKYAVIELITTSNDFIEANGDIVDRTSTTRYIYDNLSFAEIFDYKGNFLDKPSIGYDKHLPKIVKEIDEITKSIKFDNLEICIVSKIGKNLSYEETPITAAFHYKSESGIKFDINSIFISETPESISNGRKIDEFEIHDLNISINSYKEIQKCNFEEEYHNFLQEVANNLPNELAKYYPNLDKDETNLFYDSINMTINDQSLKYNFSTGKLIDDHITLTFKDNIDNGYVNTQLIFSSFNVSHNAHTIKINVSTDDIKMDLTMLSTSMRLHGITPYDKMDGKTKESLIKWETKLKKMKKQRSESANGLNSHQHIIPMSRSEKEQS